MDAMHDDSPEVDHLVGCGPEESGATFDPSGELAPPLPPVDIDVQPTTAYDVMGYGQPGTTEIAPDYTPDVTAIPTPDAPPPAPLADMPADDCGPPPAPPEWQLPDTSVEAAPPVPPFAVAGEGSFDVTGLGQPGHPDVAPESAPIDVIGLGQPGNPVVAPESGPIDVIGLGQPGNPVVDAPTVGFVGGSAPLEMTIVPGDGSTQLNEQSAGLGVIGGGPADDALAEVLGKTSNPLTEAQLMALMNSQRTMNEIWTSDASD